MKKVAIPIQFDFNTPLIISSLFIMCIVLAATIAQAGTGWLADDFNQQECALSKQLQRSPNREQYIAQLATSSHVMLASADISNSFASDAPSGFFSDESLDDENPLRNASFPFSQQIDAFSNDCLSCHDGILAQDVPINVQAGGHGFKGTNSGKEHPIGMNYQQYVSFGEGRYKALPMNSNMRLIDGQVGCLTCHNPLNPERYHLAYSNTGSSLCLACHNK